MYSFLIFIIVLKLLTTDSMNIEIQIHATVVLAQIPLGFPLFILLKIFSLGSFSFSNSFLYSRSIVALGKGDVNQSLSEPKERLFIPQTLTAIALINNSLHGSTTFARTTVAINAII